MEFENIPKEAVADWKENFVTKAVLARLRQNYEDYQNLLNGGGTLVMVSSDETAMRTSAIVSRLDELRSILNGLGEKL